MGAHPNSFTPQVCGELRFMKPLSTHVMQGIMSISEKDKTRFKAKCSQDGEKQRQAGA